MIAEIIAAGSEMLTPFRQDTNSLYLTAGLNDLGVTVAFKTIVGDTFEHLSGAARMALTRADIVIFSGGLGPTEDDLTREAAAGALGLELHPDPAIITALYKRFAERRIAMSPNNAKQADVLDGATLLPNANGTASGQLLDTTFEGKRRIVILLPGPPKELKPMFDEQVKPVLAKSLPPYFLARRQLRMALMPESIVDSRTAPIYKKYADVETTILAHSGEIQLHFQCAAASLAEAQQRVDAVAEEVEHEMGDDVFSAGGESLEEVVLLMLGMRHMTLAAAESCTGGMLAQRLTSVPGSSRYFLGGAVVYSDALKTTFADVDPAAGRTRRPGLRARRPRPRRRHPRPHRSRARRRHHRHRRPRPRHRGRPGQTGRPRLRRHRHRGGHRGQGTQPARRPRAHPLLVDPARARDDSPTAPVAAQPLLNLQEHTASMAHWILYLSIAYLLGSIPFGYLLVRVFRKQDIRESGSGNIGATNVARSGGKGLGILTLLLDLGKAYLAVELVKLFVPGNFDLAMMAAVAAILGHVFPVWLGFRGGKGVASALGVFLALSPATALCILVVFLVVVALTRYVSLASILAAACLPLLLYHFAPNASRFVIFGFLFIPFACHCQAPRQHSPAAGRHGEAVSAANPRPCRRQGGRMSRIAILGAGAWGTALAISLARRGGHTLTLWAHSTALADHLLESGENLPYLPGFTLPMDIAVTSDLPGAIFEADVLLCVTPSQHLRATLKQIAPVLTRDQIILSASKGIEEGSFLRMTQVIAAVTNNPCGVLSGPSFAQEVAAGQPTALVVAANTPTSPMRSSATSPRPPCASTPTTTSPASSSAARSRTSSRCRPASSTASAWARTPPPR